MCHAICFLCALTDKEYKGGLIIYPENVIDQVNQATANFVANNNDPKAAVITVYNCVLGLVSISFSLRVSMLIFAPQPSAFGLMFYDGPNLPDGVFDEFLAIPSLINEAYTRSFLSLARSWPSNFTSETR